MTSTMTAVTEQRTPQGQILRSALVDVERQAKALGTRKAVVVVVDGSGAEIGMALLSQDGWDITAAVKAGVKRGRFDGVGVRVTFTKD